MGGPQTAALAGPPVSGAIIALGLWAYREQRATAAGGAWRVRGFVLWRACDATSPPRPLHSSPPPAPIRAAATVGRLGTCWTAGCFGRETRCAPRAAALLSTVLSGARMATAKRKHAEHTTPAHSVVFARAGRRAVVQRRAVVPLAGWLSGRMLALRPLKMPLSL